jgi:hypothetical protein
MVMEGSTPVVLPWAALGGAGNLELDLCDQLRQLARFPTRPDTNAVFCALAGQAQLLRARRRGQLGRGFDIEAAVDELTGPIYYRTLLTSQSLPRTCSDRVVTRLLDRLDHARVH